MTTTTVDALPLPSFQEFKTLQRAWYLSAVGYAALAVFCLAAGQFDERLFNGVSVWHKPFKFALSISVYFATLVWFAKYVGPGALTTWHGKWLVGIPTFMAFFEMAYIVIMAAQGQASHYNFTSNFHALMYSLMGFGAACMVLVLPWLGILVARNVGGGHPMGLAILLGLVLTLALGGGFGSYLGGAGSHWVNAAPTDANGIWLFKWVTDGGDLRVAHFFGMHAMQALPLFALLLPSSWSAALRCALVVAFGAAYSAFTTVTFFQAVNGQPFIA